MREILLEEGRRVPPQQELGAHLGGAPGADHEQVQIGYKYNFVEEACPNKDCLFIFLHLVVLFLFWVEENTLLYKHCNGEFKPIIVRPVGPSVVLTACVQKPEITLTRLSDATMLKKVCAEHDPPVWAQARVL